MTREKMIHTEIEELLSVRDGLWESEQERVDAHLAQCDQCRTFAETLDALSEDGWNRYPAVPLTTRKKRDVLNQIATGSPAHAGRLVTPVQHWATSAAFLALIAIVCGLWLATTGPLPAPLADMLPALGSPQEEMTYYDGWELGVAFDQPTSLPIITSLWIDTQYRMQTSLMLNEAWPRPGDEWGALEPGETSAWITVANPNIHIEGSPAEKLKQAATQNELGLSTSADLMRLAGRDVIYMESKGRTFGVPQNGKAEGVTVFIGDRLVSLTITAAPDQNDQLPDIEALLADMIGSMHTVDYAGWEMWEHPTLDMTMAVPTGAVATAPRPDGAWSMTHTTQDVSFDWDLRFSQQISQGEFGSFDQYFERVRQEEGLAGASLEVEPAPIAPLNGRWSAVFRDRSLFGNDELILLGVVVDPAYQYTSRTEEGRFVIATVRIEPDELEVAQPIFEKMLRSIRGKGVPLFPTGDSIPLPGSQPVQLRESYDAAATGADPGQLEIEVVGLRTSEGQTEVDYYAKSFGLMNSFGMLTSYNFHWRTLIDPAGNRLEYLDGDLDHYSGDRDRPPGTLRFNDTVNLTLEGPYLLTADVLLQGLPANRPLTLDFSGKDWGDVWGMDETVYMNGHEIFIMEGRLEEEDRRLVLTGQLGNSFYPTDIAAIFHDAGSDLFFRLEADGQLLFWTFLDEAVPTEPQVYALEGKITYRDAAQFSFIVDEFGRVID